MKGLSGDQDQENKKLTLPEFVFNPREGSLAWNSIFKEKEGATMIVISDSTSLTLLLNNVLRKGKDPKQVVEQLSQGLDEHLLLPPVRLVALGAGKVWQWLGPRLRPRAAQEGSRLLTTPELRLKGTTGFESSKQRALDRANAWQIPQPARQVSGRLGVPQHPRTRPVEPMYVCPATTAEATQSSAQRPEASNEAAPAAVSEEHPPLSIARC
jgi:hypothetical protein